ncbi:MAG: hypothetical protein M1546_17050 [Chloroflexi bacterium]|nr:hypothetical protein [Chloroflexota bacterium]
MQNRFLKIETKTSDPIISGKTVLRLSSQVLTVQLPFGVGSWGFIWNRPVAVIQQDAAGQQQIASVVDLTRVLQIAILTAGVISAVIIARMVRRSA